MQFFVDQQESINCGQELHVLYLASEVYFKIQILKIHKI